jgi:hypothetical protein
MHKRVHRCRRLYGAGFEQVDEDLQIQHLIVVSLHSLHVISLTNGLGFISATVGLPASTCIYLHVPVRRPYKANLRHVVEA